MRKSSSCSETDTAPDEAVGSLSPPATKICSRVRAESLSTKSPTSSAPSSDPDFTLWTWAVVQTCSGREDRLVVSQTVPAVPGERLVVLGVLDRGHPGRDDVSPAPGPPDWPGHKTRAVSDKIREVFEGGRVEDFVPDGRFVGPDPHDQHVHAAALACGAGILLTADSGFSSPVASEAGSPYEVYMPDDFFVLVDDSAPDIVRAVVSQQQHYWLARHGRANLSQSLISAGCHGFADRVRRDLQELDARAG